MSARRYFKYNIENKYRTVKLYYKLQLNVNETIVDKMCYAVGNYTEINSKHDLSENCIRWAIGSKIR